MSTELERIMALGNEGAPAEWLAHLTGEGVGEGFEGAHGEELDRLMAEGPSEPELPIQATPETAFLQCHGTNYTRGRGGCRIEWIVVHYTAGSVTAAGAANANARYFASNADRGASAHYFVDDGHTVWQSVADGDTAWAVGVWSLNQRSVSVEVCSDGAFTPSEVERLSWLVRMLMARHGVPADHVIRHYDCNGKRCPAHYVDEARWRDLHARITSGETEAERVERERVEGLPGPLKGYRDLWPGSWYVEPVRRAVEAGIMRGYPDGTWRPDAPVTRAEAVAVVANRLGADVKPMPYDDIAPWYAAAIVWAEGAGVLAPGDHARPEEPATRAEVATMLWRAAGGPAADASKAASLGDWGEVPEWARQPVAWAVAHGLMGNGGAIDAGGACTRAMAAAMTMAS